MSDAGIEPTPLRFVHVPDAILSFCKHNKLARDEVFSVFTLDFPAVQRESPGIPGQ
jgi:hypothetical protein